MQDITEFIEKLFFYLLKLVDYLMKVSLGLVIGISLGLVFYISLKNNMGKYLFFICLGIGIISGIIYAEKRRRNSKSSNYESKNKN